MKKIKMLVIIFWKNSICLIVTGGVVRIFVFIIPNIIFDSVRRRHRILEKMNGHGRYRPLLSRRLQISRRPQRHLFSLKKIYFYFFSTCLVSMAWVANRRLECHSHRYACQILVIKQWFTKRDSIESREFFLKRNIKHGLDK